MCLHRGVQFTVLIFSKSFCLMTFYQCYYDFINISISAVNYHISQQSPVWPIISPDHSACVNEQFNLEQRKDLFSTGLGTVSLLQLMAQLYLQLSRDDLSAAETTLPFMFFTFLISSLFFLGVLQLRPFFKCVKLSVNRSLQPALPTIFYEQTGVLLL